MEPQPTTVIEQGRFRTPILILLIIIIAIAGFFVVQNLNTTPDMVPVPTETPDMTSQTETQEPVPAEGEVRPDGTTVISGTIVEILTQQDSPDKWVTLLYTDSLENMLEYKFYISADTAANAPIEGGAKVSITFIGQPSATDFVLAKAITASTN